MLAERFTAIPGLSVEQALRQQILQRTWNRIRGLAVEATVEGVFVGGSVPSYYTKQLALVAIQEVMGRENPARLELDIRVQSDQGRSTVCDDN